MPSGEAGFMDARQTMAPHRDPMTTAPTAMTSTTGRTLDQTVNSLGLSE